MKKIFLMSILFGLAVVSFADDYTVIHYHQPGLVEAVGRTAVGLTYEVGATAVGLTQAVGQTAVGLTGGYNRTIIVPNQTVYQPQVIYQRPAATVDYYYPGQGTPVLVGPAYGAYGAYPAAPVVYTGAPAARYVGGNIYYTAY